MERYPVDIDPEQVVRWIKAECEATPSTFRTTARRAREVRQIPVSGKTHLGDDEREDLSEIATIATLDIAPAHASDGWLLSVVVEDEIGPHSLGAGSVGEEEQIDLGAFYSAFIRPGRGNATVSADVEDPAARARLTRLLSLIETNRHSPAGRAAPR
jgi:hypothetical protein